MTTPAARAATFHALRTATAVTVCLALAEWWNLPHANLAVWTTYMVMAQYTTTSFQKGVERILGRGLGILAGLVITTLLEGAPVIGFLMINLVLAVCFYIYFAGRLAYTFLNAGLYAVALFQLGYAAPNEAATIAAELFAAVVLGVLVADAITWLSAAESSLHIEAGAAPLWPVRGDWLSQSLMLVVTVVLTVIGANLIDLPADKAAISVMLLTVAPHLQALLWKGELRIAGAVLATAWAFSMFLLLGSLQSFFLLAGLLFLGQFLAAYLTRMGGQYSYAGLQMGLVLPMLVVAPPSEFGSLTAAIQRLEGIGIALSASLLVGGLWPRFPLRDNPPGSA